MRPISLRNETSSRIVDLTLFLLVFAVFAMVLVLSPPIWQHGEAREGLVVQSILKNHTWVLPLRNGELPSKPPLFHWAAAGLADIFGFSDTTVRLPSVIGAFLMLFATFSFAKRIGGRQTAWLAVAVLLGTHEYWDSATEARVDMIFSATVTTSLVAWFTWYRTGRFRSQVTCYLAVACAVLSKGPAGVVLPGAAILAFLFVEGELRRIYDFWSWPLALVVMFLDLGWYAAAFFAGGELFFMKQIVSENIDRFVGTGNFTAHHHSLTPLVWLATRILPWNIVLLVALFRRLRGQREDSAGRFLHAWWSILFVIVFLAAGQRAVYLLPIYPAVAILAARALGQWVESGDWMPVAHHSQRLYVAGAVPAMPKRSLVLALAVGLIIMGHTIAAPIVSWSKMNKDAETAFVKKAMGLLPKDASVVADPSFSESALIILAYRLNRPIPRAVVTCQGAGYYLAMQSALPACLMVQRPLASTGQGDAALVLVEVTGRGRGS